MRTFVISFLRMIFIEVTAREGDIGGECIYHCEPIDTPASDWQVIPAVL